jgi:hypothetical protein
MARMIRAASVVIFAGLISAASAAESSAQADRLIEAAKKAMGGPAWDGAITWHETGKVAGGGLKGTYETWTDLTSLHNTGSYVLGPDSGSNGWDGKHAWTTDSSKEVRIETSGEAVAQAIQDAYRGAYGFFFPRRFPAARDYAGTRKESGRSYESVKVTPVGAEPFEVWFDPATHLIVREVQLTGGHPHSYLFSNFSEFAGLRVPGKTIDRVAGDPKYDTVIEVGAIALVGPEEPSRYAAPPPPPNTAQWPAGKDSVTVPFRLINNHIYVDASINGSTPLPFVFDTGATDIIQTSAAKILGIAVEGALPGGGLGDKMEDFGFAKVKSVAIGGLTLPDQLFGTETSPAWAAIEGADSAGLLGYEFVKRAVLSIDYAARTLTFTKQELFHPPKNAGAIAFTFQSHIPMVAGTLDGVAGEFMIDTGSRGALTVMRPFAVANDLVGKYHATRSATIGYGVGGPVRALLARSSKFVLGPVTIDAPVTEILTDKAGAAQSARTAGNIGGDILKRFTMTLDYAHQTLWLQPNSLAGQREVFDRSGLWVSRAKDGGIEIADVAPASAGASIGLVAGEEIVSVNDRSAKDVALPDLREEFKSAVGTTFKLVAKGKKGERTLTLVLADQV